MTNQRSIGSEYEKLAVIFLKNQGYEILERNFRCRMGEIDIIAREEEYLCFIEVKYRKNDRQGGALYAVNNKKQQTISRVSSYYIMRNRLPDATPIRYDVVGITGSSVELVRNAYSYWG